MEYHYRFLDDAVETFLESFKTYEDLRHLGENEADRRHFPHISRCIRSLYIALEKGFKHGLAQRDPYLPVSLPKVDTLIEAIKEKIAKRLPTIYCGGAYMETVDLQAAWKLLSKFDPQSDNSSVGTAFGVAIKRLRDVRNLAQHGEFYADPSELVATVEQVFLHFYEACHGLVPDWIELMCEREPQLESRLRSVKQRVDGSWQVAIDYLRTHGAIEYPCQCWIASTSEQGMVDFLFGRSQGFIGIEGGGLGSATGLFAQYLTQAQVEMRREQRRLAQRADGEQDEPAIGDLSLGALLARANQRVEKAPTKQAPLLPLQSGKVNLAGASAMLRLQAPSALYVYSRLRNLVVEFDRPEQSTGTLTGVLESALPTGDNVPCITLTGIVELSYEFESLPKEGERQRTIWELVGNMTLAVS